MSTKAKGKDAVKRFSARLRADLLVKAGRAAAIKRWSINDYIEEAIIEKLAYEEPVKK